MKQKMWRRYLPLLLSFLLVSSVWLGPVTATEEGDRELSFETGTDISVIREGSALPTGGVIQAVGVPMPEDVSASVICRDKGTALNYYTPLQNRGSTDYCYLNISSDKMKSAYEKIYGALEQYEYSDDFSKKDYTASNCYCAVVYFDAVVSEANALVVFNAVMADNPRFFWVDVSAFGQAGSGSSVGGIGIIVAEEYRKAADRSAAQEIISSEGSRISYDLTRYETDYEKALALHDILCKRIDYTYDADGKPCSSIWAHNIVGILSGQGTVCEGYAKTYAYFLNKAGVPAAVLIGLGNGGGHAWNAIKLENTYYLCDVTWDDLNNGVSRSDDVLEAYNHYAYFCIPRSVFYKTHTDGNTMGTGGIYSVSPKAQTFSDSDRYSYYLVYSCDLGQYDDTAEGLAGLRSRIDEALAHQHGRYLHLRTEASLKMIGYVINDVDGKTEGDVFRSCRSASGTDYYYYSTKIDIAPPPAPDGPKVSAVGADYIYLEPCDYCEYSLDGILWQSSPYFRHLEPDTEYTFYVRRYESVFAPAGLIGKAKILSGAKPSASFAGKGTRFDPYLLSSRSDLLLLAKRVNAGETFEGVFFRMTQNIRLALPNAFSYDASGRITGINENTPPALWEPIGGYREVAADEIFDSHSFTEAKTAYGELYTENDGIYTPALTYTAGVPYCFLAKFCGKLDGNGCTVSGLCTDPAGGCRGLFGYTGKGSSVSRLAVTGSYLCGTEGVGALCGVSEGSVSDCYTDSSAVVASGSYAGGILGRGIGADSTVIRCYSRSLVSGASDTGALCGTGASVLGCYYLTGSAVCGETAQGGLGDGTADAPGVAVGLTDTQMIREESFAGWDFDGTWTMEGNADYLCPELLPNPLRFDGDFDQNGIIDMADAVHFIGWINFGYLPELFPMIYEGNKDFNKDGTIDMQDAVYLTGWINFGYLPGLFDIEW